METERGSDIAQVVIATLLHSPYVQCGLYSQCYSTMIYSTEMNNFIVLATINRSS